MCRPPPPNAKMPITILQFMTLKDLLWMKKSTHQTYPHAFEFEPEEIKLSNIRRQSMRNYGKSFPENGLEAMSFSLQRLKKRRRQSFRYRHLELYQSLPVEIIQTEDLFEFKQYCIENVIQDYDPNDKKLVEDLFNGTLRRNYLKQLDKQFQLRKMKEREIEETDSECSDIE